MTIKADEDSEILVFDGHNLDRVYEVTPRLSLIIDCLVAKDITRCVLLEDTQINTRSLNYLAKMFR